MADNQTAMMPTEDWLAICASITKEFGMNFPMCSGDIPGLLDAIANGTTKEMKEGE